VPRPRKAIVDRALQYLDSLSKESSGDVSLRRDLATEYVHQVLNFVEPALSEQKPVLHLAADSYSSLGDLELPRSRQYPAFSAKLNF
jgi:hypothetical protein